MKTETTTNPSETVPVQSPTNNSPCPDASPVDGAALLDKLALTFRRFVVLPKWADTALALWTVHTHAFQLRDVTAYIGIESPEKRCGKTTLLSVLNAIVNRPVVSTNISSPAFYRVIEEARPTLLIDEADTFLQGNDELRGILNSGYSRQTAFVVRVANQSNAEISGEEAEWISGTRIPRPSGGGGSRLARFSTWCPKAIATIGRLPDTLSDRCILLRMQRKAVGETCERLRHLDTAELRHQCARFVLDHADAIARARPVIPDTLNDRAADIWEPLFAIADLAGGPWPEQARAAATALMSQAQELNPVASLLRDIQIVFDSSEMERIFSRSMVHFLNAAGERPWNELSRGKEITELWLSFQLRPYGVKPRTIRIGEERAKGYQREDFDEVFRRYIPKSDTPTNPE